MAGRNSKYDLCIRPYLAEISKKVRQGIIEEDIAKSLGISVATLNNYKLKYPELKEALSKDKGKEVLDKLVNNGIQAAMGYYKDETTIVEKNGEKIITSTRRWFPPNATLNIFYVKNFGKEEGYASDPLELSMKKAKQELDELIIKEKNWTLNIEKKDD